MDQDDLEDEVFSQTILIQAEILYKWQKRYVLQTEVLYALAFVLSVALCWAKKTGLLVLTVGGPSEESSEQKVADAAVFALKGRRATMEDRFAMIQVPVPHLPDQPIVRIFAILDGHGGQVSDHTVRNLHFLSKNSTLISRENLSISLGEKLVKMLWFWTF